MPYRTRSAIALLTAVLMGSAAHAQPAAPAATAPGYYVSEFEVTDAEGIKPYSAQVESTFTPFGGRYIVRGGRVDSLEGAPTQRIVMIEFPSQAQARAWYDSPAYTALRPIRQRSATSQVFVVEGLSAVAATSATPTAATPSTATASATETASAGQPAARPMTIAPNGSQPSARGPAQNFSGTVRVDPLFQPTAPSRVSGAYVTFEPGARSAWHTHPLGQTLVVTAGTGWVQQWGGPRHEMKPGDVITTPPGVKHWHGATATNSVTHLALQEALDGKNVEWLEKVSDAQYQP